jgi:hypothetical protein
MPDVKKSGVQCIKRQSLSRNALLYNKRALQHPMVFNAKGRERERSSKMSSLSGNVGTKVAQLPKS